MPDEQVLGLEGAERVARRRETEQQVHSCGVAARREEPVRADRLGDDERPLRRPPERRLAPSLRALEGDRLERAVRETRRVRRRAVRRAPGRPPRSRGCGGRGAGARRPPPPAPEHARAPARSEQDRRATPGRRRRGRATCASSARRRSTRTPARRGRRRTGSSCAERSQRTVARSARCRTSDMRERLVVPGPARRGSPVVDRPESREGSFPAPGASLQPPPGAPRCPWCHAIEDLVTGVCRLCADSVPADDGGRRGAGRRLVRRRGSAWVPAHTARRAANRGRRGAP